MTSRRSFLRTAAATSIAAPFVSRLSWAQGNSPMQRVQHVGVGIGGKGWSDIHDITSHAKAELVAAADIDTKNFARLAESKPGAKPYQDWREMFDKVEFDSVSVSTPDHMHACIGLSAMNMGKHVYGQKPLAARIGEARQMTEKAAENPHLVTQMGNQLASSLQERLGVEMIRAGAIGKIREVHVFSNKNWGDDNPIPEGEDEVPATLDWDGWCGVSALRPFKGGVYHPGNWRRRQDYGTGCLGDMGCHIFNPVFRGLGLAPPISVKSESGVTNPDSWATKELVHWVYPGNELIEGETIDITWYSGSIRPPAEVLAHITADRHVGQGSIYVGSEGVMQVPHGSTPSLWPPEDFEGFNYPKIEPANHYHEFIDCILGDQEEAPISNFLYAGPTTESILMGTVASIFPDQELLWDAENCRFTNVEQANEYIAPRARGEWQVREAAPAGV